MEKTRVPEELKGTLKIPSESCSRGRRSIKLSIKSKNYNQKSCKHQKNQVSATISDP